MLPEYYNTGTVSIFSFYLPQIAFATLEALSFMQRSIFISSLGDPEHLHPNADEEEHEEKHLDGEDSRLWLQQDKKNAFFK